jgi:hypothetical protein
MSDEPDFADTLHGEMILEMVADGKTLKFACESIGVGYSTVFFKIGKNPVFKERMEEARAAGYEVLAEECLEIADETAFDMTETERGLKPNKEWMQRSKLRVETRLKLLAKWHPKKYGEKLEIESKTATVAIPTGDDPIAAQRAYEALMKGTG